MNIEDGVRAALRERIAYAPQDAFAEDCEPSGELRDAITEVADGCVPLYNADLAQALRDDLSLAQPDDDSLIPENPDVWQILQVSIYERLSHAAHEHADEIASYLRDFLPAYLAALAWVDDVPEPENEDEARADCARFVAEQWPALDLNVYHYDASHAGHDFALTRNEQGTGYWDRPELNHSVNGCRHFSDDETRTLGRILTDAASKYPPAHLLVNDDGETEYLTG